LVQPPCTSSTVEDISVYLVPGVRRLSLFGESSFAATVNIVMIDSLISGKLGAILRTANVLRHFDVSWVVYLTKGVRIRTKAQKKNNTVSNLTLDATLLVEK